MGNPIGSGYSINQLDSMRQNNSDVYNPTQRQRLNDQAGNEVTIWEIQDLGWGQLDDFLESQGINSDTHAIGRLGDNDINGDGETGYGVVTTER